LRGPWTGLPSAGGKQSPLSSPLRQGCQVDGPASGALHHGLRHAGVDHASGLDTTIGECRYAAHARARFTQPRIRWAWVPGPRTSSPPRFMTAHEGGLARRSDRPQRRVFLYYVRDQSGVHAFCGARAITFRRFVLRGCLQRVVRAGASRVAGGAARHQTRPRVTARAMGGWVMGVTLGPIIGPALGGW